MLPFRKSALPSTLAVVIPASVFIVVIGFAFGERWIAPECFLFVAAWYLSSRRDQVLSKRAYRSASPTWSVSMGGVLIGNLSDAHYAALYRAALRDLRTAVRHGLGLMRWLAGFAGHIAWLVPLLFFWALAWVAVTNPHAYLPMVHRLVAHGPAGFVSQIGIAIALAVLIEMIGIAVGLNALPDAYEPVLHQLVRQHFGLAANSPIALLWESSEPPPFEAGVRSPVQKLSGFG